MSKSFIIIVIIIFIVFFGFWGFNTREKNLSIGENSPGQMFSQDGLKTDTSISSIDLSNVLDGGPGKDGIPAINNPKFVPIKEAGILMSNDVMGILLVRGQTAKFYPYNILVWHEVVNDTIEGESVVVTFCPLCASVLVFDANVDGKKENFGVSGKLYESNLLMYDHDTESLWSQIKGEAVVGKKTGKQLTNVPFLVMSLGEAKKRFPEAKIMSINTGFIRNYAFYPYGDYNENEDIYFPISITDTRLPLKEPMYIVNVFESSVAFKILDLKEGVRARVSVGTKEITAESKDGDIIVKWSDGKAIPGYYALWFSWAIHHQEDGIVWTGKNVIKLKQN